MCLGTEPVSSAETQADVTPREYLDLLADYSVVIYQVSAEVGDATCAIVRIWHVIPRWLADVPLAGQVVLRILVWYAPRRSPPVLLDGAGRILRCYARSAAWAPKAYAPPRQAVTSHRLVQARPARPTACTCRDN